HMVETSLRKLERLCDYHPPISTQVALACHLSGSINIVGSRVEHLPELHAPPCNALPANRRRRWAALRSRVSPRSGSHIPLIRRETKQGPTSGYHLDAAQQTHGRCR